MTYFLRESMPLVSFGERTFSSNDETPGLVRGNTFFPNPSKKYMPEENFLEYCVEA